MLVPRAPVLALVAAALLSSCSAEAGQDDELRVVTGLYPLQFVAERVAGPHAEVVGLTSPGQEPHDLELSPQMTAAVADADVAVHVPGFQPALDEAVETESPAQVVDVLALAPSSGGDAPADLHVWLDPRTMVGLAEELEATLSELDPDHRADYRAAAAALTDELERLDADYREGLADCDVDTAVVSHDAFGHLPVPFDFEPINGSSPGAEPSPQRLAELADLITERGVTTVFSEPLDTPELAQTLADDLGLEVRSLDPVEGLSEESEGEDYLSLMRANLETLEEANGCR